MYKSTVWAHSSVATEHDRHGGTSTVKTTDIDQGYTNVTTIIIIMTGILLKDTPTLLNFLVSRILTDRGTLTVYSPSIDKRSKCDIRVKPCDQGELRLKTSGSVFRSTKGGTLLGTIRGRVSSGKVKPRWGRVFGVRGETRPKWIHDSVPTPRYSSPIPIPVSIDLTFVLHVTLYRILVEGLLLR